MDHDDRKKKDPTGKPTDPAIGKGPPGGDGNGNDPGTGESAPGPRTPTGFNIASLRLQHNVMQVGIQKVVTTIPVRKPSRHEFVRVRPEAEYMLETGVLELKDDRDELYLVERQLWDAVPDIKPMVLRTAISRQKVLFVWPIRLPGVDGRIDTWTDSAHSAAALAEAQWVSVRSNRALGAYEPFIAAGALADPEWPAMGFEQILQIAFRGRFIDSLDHPVLRRLRGEV